MKTLIKSLPGLFFLLSIAFLFSCGPSTPDKNEDSSGTESELGGSASAAQTTLIIKNNMPDSVPVFMSFNANGDACTNNMNNTSISFCKPVPGGNVCTFKIAGGATVPIPNAPGKNLCGGLYFYGNGNATVNKDCTQGGAFPTGLTKAEYSLNCDAGWEGINISLVNGFNCYMQILLDSGTSNAKWSASEISNKGLNENANRLGVYPNGCDLCLSRGNPPCTQPPHPSGNTGCSSNNQCHLVRGGAGSGGTVTINLNPSAPAS